MGEENTTNKFSKEKGFTLVGKPYSPKYSERVGIEFRPGETNDRIIKAEKAKEQEERQRQQDTEMTPEQLARKDREWIAEWFEGGIAESGEYSETLGIEEDGGLNRQKRPDDNSSPFITSAGKLKSSADLYEFMKKIQEEHPQLNVSFETDPTGKWIKYRVSKNVVE